MSDERPIAISVGDPAGVGPEVSVRAAFALAEQVPSVIFGDAAQLHAIAHARQLDDARWVECDEQRLADALPPGSVGYVDTGRVSPAILARHAASAEGGEAQHATLLRAARSAQAGLARALVTGPTSKAAIVQAGHPFVGQTELLAQRDGRADDAVTMMFLGPRLRVALVTTHLAITQVPGAIRCERVVRTVHHLAEALLRLRGDGRCSVLVAGLNPHAGEDGLFGSEEREVIGPALEGLQRDPAFARCVQLSGPAPAEAAFRAAQRGDVDGIVAMFHDQATIASKLLDWGAAVNTTWGLSFVRTSVDHGVAYDAARAGRVEADGMHAALALAVRLTKGGDG